MNELPRELLVQVVRSARRRLRIRLALQGLSILAIAGLALGLAAALGIDHFRFTPLATWIFRIAAFGGLAALTAWFVVRPQLIPVSDERAALYLEEHAPELEQHLLSALSSVESPGGARYSPALVQRLADEALSRCARIENGRAIEQPAIVRSSGVLAGATLVGAAMFLLGPGALRRGAAGLLPGAVGASPYRISVTPRDTVVARGSDLKVSATLQRFTADHVEIAVRRTAQGEWQRFPMTVDQQGGRFTILLFDLADPADYFVEAGGVRSPLIHVGVADLPYVKRIDLEYHYPAYTGLPVERVEDGGDVAAVRGTVVRVTVVPTVAAAAAMLLVEGGDTVALEPRSSGEMVGELKVQRPGSYRVMFQSPVAGMVVGSPEYLIDVLADQPPTVRFRTPGRDLPVTSIEEVFTEAEAHDDFGIGPFDLIYQVNGGEERVVPLKDAARSVKEATGSHTFFLEEHELKPGDLVSYYARVAEAAHAGGAQQATTDIYFLQVRPFDREYRAADQQPGGGGAGGMASPGELSQRQRDIVAGTFNVLRDSVRYAEKDFRENLATLALAQGRLREDVTNLVSRIQERGITGLDSTFKTVADALQAAVGDMEAAEQRLGERKPKEALTPEQLALQQLQRAEAAYKEFQVARSSGGGGGASANQPTAEELADLFDLELDKLRNQYEQVERGQRQETDNQVDATMERLRELARRQQQENERLRARMQEQAAGAGGSSGSQRELAQQAEELARQLERLSREQSQPQLSETARQLRDAAEAMRRASAQGASEGTTQGRAALDRLRDAQRSLEQDRTGRLKRDADDAVRRAEQLAEQERKSQQEVSGLSGQAAADAEQIRRLDQRKADMAEQVQGLEQDVDRMARESRRDQPDASRKLAEAADGIRGSKLREKILYSRGVIRGRSPDYARNFEDQIGTDIESLRKRLAAARDAVGESREQRVARALERAGDLVNGLESMEQRLRNQGSGNEETAAREGQGQEGQAQGSPAGQGQAGQQGQGGRNAGGGAPGAPQTSSGRAGPGGPGSWARPDSRQLERELRERVGDADRLRNDLRQEGVDVAELGRIIQRLRELDRRIVTGDQRALTALQNDVIQGLKEFEFALRRQFASADEQRPFGTAADEVPERYRKLVEEYYKALAGKKP